MTSIERFLIKLTIDVFALLQVDGGNVAISEIDGPVVRLELHVRPRRCVHPPFSIAAQIERFGLLLGSSRVNAARVPAQPKR